MLTSWAHSTSFLEQTNKSNKMAANSKTTTLTLYIEHDGDFSGAHVVGGSADVFSRVLAAHAWQHQAIVHHLVSPR